MLVAGDYSPHLNDTVAMNARLDPSNSTWMKVTVTQAKHNEDLRFSMAQFDSFCVITCCYY